MTRHKKTRSKKPKPKHFRYAVRIGLVPGIYPSYENGAKEQVEHIAACHQGFTKRQVSLNLHHCYMQTVLGDEQVRKFKEELLRDTAPYCPRPYAYYDCDLRRRSSVFMEVVRRLAVVCWGGEALCFLRKTRPTYTTSSFLPEVGAAGGPTL